MQTVTIKLTNKDARILEVALRKKLEAHGNVSLATLIEKAAWRLAIEQLQEESYAAYQAIDEGEQQ